ncbi:DUF1835 domain-containing protein [Clostridium sp. WLY-B-L2]|uniref:DUF1835 domain-containing protein n=1 Tax=Clostridium aromativorans TaxID=2836848 RepID=A0ABS8N939_9CLOT|nr:DUF1835 domain-containing protein [Clostridium aromativorans]MCC9296161.1 DUF1835 domain-containing protein [Clostridium aromativorans]
MSGEIIHICCSDSPYGSIKYAIGTGLLDGKKVIGFFDDLSNGPIDKFIELKERINWCKKICIEEDNKTFGEIKEDYKKLDDDLMKIKDEDIYLWYGNNPAEICGMLYVLSMIEEKIHNLYTINVSDITYNTGKRNEFTPRTVGEVIGKAENYVSDIFIFWRITELIKSGKIVYRGNLNLMRELEIKKV